MFIGYKWLKLHNPSIDWKKGNLEFNRCPLDCIPLIMPNFPGEVGGEEDGDLEIEEGERLFLVDLETEMNI